jgi:hypothetical protein
LQFPEHGASDLPLYGMSALLGLKYGAFIPTTIVGTNAPPAEKFENGGINPPLHTAQPIFQHRAASLYYDRKHFLGPPGV